MGVDEAYNENAFEQTAMVVSGPVRREAGMQESDLLDQLPDGEAQKDSGTDHVMLVSLGCFCGPKLSFKHIGRGAETLPFDWMRTRHSGLVHFLRNDFDGFFDFNTKKSVPNCSMTTYRSYYHSFWHDDPTDPGMRERYERRIARFNRIDASSQPVLFVRTLPTTDEIKDAPELLEELRKRHGLHACLLLIIDFQMTAKGAAIVDGHEHLLVYYLSGDHHVAEDGVTPTPPYCKPVLCALDWIVGKPIQAMRFCDLEKVAACADETHWGIQGLGGLNAFEASPEGPEEEAAAEAGGPRPSALPALSSEELERPVAAAAPQDGVTLVSLGCCGLTKRTLQRMGRGAEALPFDWLQVSHEGLLHFLRKGFKAPIRSGLGAGGQRPAECHGFLDFATRRPVPGTGLQMCRSHLHSFWHDDLAQPEVKARFEKRIDAFERLASGSNALLFVRVVATTAELARADELLSALTKKFGPRACLLVVADFQKTHPGPYVVEGYEDLLAYFLDSSGARAEEAEAPYRRAVECSLDWLQGNPLEAACVPDLRTLHELADESSWGLAGLGGLNAFEGATMRPEDSDEKAAGAKPSAEDAWLEAAKLEAAKESVALVSLGSHAGTAKAFQALSLAPEASPFDQVWVRVEGIIHFLHNDFKDFFEVATTERVPGTSLVARRSYYHSFWEAHSSDAAAVREAHERSIEHFRSTLARSDRPKLFVHALAATEELGSVGELLAALARRFSGRVCLMVIVGGQPQPRLVSVEGHYNVLVHFITDNPQRALDGVAYCEPIKRSLDWVVGKPVQASVVADFDSLLGLASPVRAPLAGPGGLPAFEEEPGDGSTSTQSSLSPASNLPAEKDLAPTPEGGSVMKALGTLFTTG